MNIILKFKRTLWRNIKHRPYVTLGTTRCYRCGYHYNSWHKGA